MTYYRESQLAAEQLDTVAYNYALGWDDRNRLSSAKAHATRKGIPSQVQVKVIIRSFARVIDTVRLSNDRLGEVVLRLDALAFCKSQS